MHALAGTLARKGRMRGMQAAAGALLAACGEKDEKAEEKHAVLRAGRGRSTEGKQRILLQCRPTPNPSHAQHSSPAVWLVRANGSR